MNSKIVSIIGRPNVGKSTIFNRLTKSKRKSMTFDTPGVTRDGHYGFMVLDELASEQISPIDLLIVDTGGFYMDKSKVVEAGVRQEEILWEQVATQSLAAIGESDFCLVVVDVRQGLTPADQDIIRMLRENDKKFWLLINKCDAPKQDIEAFDFFQLGLEEEEVFLVSAEHDIGFDDLRQQLQFLLYHLEKQDDRVDIASAVIPNFPLIGSLAIIGAPNVGKSTLLNKLIGIDRSIVSPVAGTTVDPVEAYLNIEVGEAAQAVDEFWHQQDMGYLGGFLAQPTKPLYDEHESKRSILILDTAGIRRQSVVEGFIETQSVYRSLRCMTEASLVVYVIDAHKGLTHQDRHLIGLSLEKGKTIFLVLNKFDLVKKQLHQEKVKVEEWKEHWQTMVPWLEFCEMLPVSAKTGEGVREIKHKIREFFISRADQVSTGELNRVVQALIQEKPLNFHEGKGVALKLKYASMVRNFPPTILLFTNKSQNIPLHYRRYLVNGIREGMGWKNTSVHLIFRTNSDHQKREEQYAPEVEYDTEENYQETR